MVSLSAVVGHSRMQYEGTYPLLDIGVVQAGGGGGKEPESGRLRKCQSPVCKVLCVTHSPLGATGTTWSHFHSQCRMSYISCTPCDMYAHTHTHTQTDRQKGLNKIH